MSMEFAPDLVAWVYAIGWTLLHFLWQGALVGAAYGAARLVMREARPQTRYVLGLSALALLAALPVFTLIQLAPRTAAEVAQAGVVAGGVMSAVFEPQASYGFEPWLPWLVGAWLVGVVLFSLRALYQYLKLRRLCRLGAEPLPEWEGRLKVMCHRFGVLQPVRVIKSAIIETPSLVGWIAPIIVLPAAVLVGLTPQQIELVIAHELGHIRRWDYAVNLMQIALETVLFYHPVVYWISREVRNDREACCDDLVLRLGADPVAYAATLASLEELRGVTHVPALAASGGFLLGRIRRIVGVEPRFAAPLSGAQAIVLSLLAVAAILGVKPVTREALAPDAASAVAALLNPAAPAAEPLSASLARAAGMTLDSMRAATVAPASAPASTAVAPEAALPAAEAVATLPTAESALPRPARTMLALSTPTLARPEISAPAVADLSFERAGRSRLIAPPSAAESKITALTMVAPEFPRRAALAGLEGQVTLGFAVDAAGRARDIKVIESSDPSEFNGPAIAALRGWRFDAAVGSPGQRYVQTFDFSLSGGSGQASATDECDYAVGSRICRRMSAVEEAAAAD